MLKVSKDFLENVRFQLVHPRDLLQSYYSALASEDPNGDRNKQLTIGKQIALCHIFSEIFTGTQSTLERKWMRFKKYWEAIEGAHYLLPMIEPIFYKNVFNKTPICVSLTSFFDLEWTKIWTIAQLVGRVVEDYSRASVFYGDKNLQINWMQSPKKRSGAFYTPPSLARFIARRIADIWKEPWESTRIFDPSVGCGYFLLAIAEIYARSVGKKYPEKYQTFLAHNLFGVDKDLGAITATILLLGLTGGLDPVIPAIRKNIYQADMLQMDVVDQYHIVIGNPPWGCIRSGERKKYARKYPMCNDFENFEYFSVQGMNATVTGGLHAFVVPNTFFRNTLSVKFRKWYVSQAQFTEIHDFTNVPLFDDASVRCCVIISRKLADPEITTKIFVHSLKALDEVKATFSFSPNWFQSNINFWHWIHINPSIIKGIYSPMITNSSPLSKYTETKQGFIPYRYTTLLSRFRSRFSMYASEYSYNNKSVEEILQGVWPTHVPLPFIPEITRENYYVIAQNLARRIVDERLWHKNCPPNEPVPEGYLPLLKGRNIRAFTINWEGECFAYGPHVSSYVEHRFFSKPRLLFPEIIGKAPYQVQAAYTTDTFVHDPQVLNAVFKEGIDPRWHWFCLAAANSLPISAFMAISAPKVCKGLFSKLLVRDVKQIPIPLDPSYLKEIELELIELWQQPPDLENLTKIIQQENLQLTSIVEAGIRIAMEGTRLCNSNVKITNASKRLTRLRALNDLLFCRLFKVDLDLCRQVAMGKYL